jgi:hypothetical protein
MKKITIEITESEAYLISKVFQNYYCTGIEDMIKEDKRMESLFTKIESLLTYEEQE